MKRREALKTLGFAAAGLVALPAWARGWNPKEIALPSSSFSTNEQAILSSAAGTIIPEKDGVGAIPLEVDKFLLRLFEECYQEEVRANIKLQLAELNQNAIDSHGKSFTECSQAEREELLLTFSESELESKKRFFELVKSETIRGFRTSKVVMQDYHGYRVVPGRYNGNVDAEA